MFIGIFEPAYYYKNFKLRRGLQHVLRLSLSPLAVMLEFSGPVKSFAFWLIFSN